MFCEFLFSLSKTLSKRANQKSKKLFCKPFSRQARNGFSLLSGCRGDSFLFFFLFSLSECTFSPQKRKVSRRKQNMSFLCKNHFQLANPESLTTPDSPIRSLVVIVLKLKSQLSSFENLRGIVRPLKLSEVKSLSKPKSLSMSKKGQFLKDFSIQICLFFPFQLCPLTTEAMGLGGLRANFLSQ